MLSGSFYTTNQIEQSPGAVTASIVFNDAHPIFKGHFPSIPVVPGVCMMQIVKEILEQTISSKTKLTHAGNLKFLSLITPAQTPSVILKMNFTGTGDEYDVQAELTNGTQTFFKFRGTLAKETT